MSTKLQRVAISAASIRSQLKAAKGTPQMVLALSGRKEVGSSQFHAWMRAGAIPVDVADVLTKYFDIDL